MMAEAAKIPTFSLGTHTAPEPPSSTNRALERFAVRGNAIVTGGARGLGLSAGKALLDHGLQTLIIFDLNQEEGMKTEKALTEAWPERTIRFRLVNVTDSDLVDAAVNQVVEEFEQIDILLCYAGIAHCEHADRYEASMWRKIIDVNTNGVFFTTQAVGKYVYSF
jgi:sorbose reductase